MYKNDSNVSGHHHRSQPHQEEDIDINLEHYQAQDGLGFCLCGSRSSGVFVKFAEAEMFNESNKRLNTGDQILKINDVALTGLTPDQVVRILRNSLSNTGHVTIKVARDVDSAPTKCPSAKRTASNPAVLHSFSDGHLGVYSPMPISRDQQQAGGTDSPLMLPHFVEVHKRPHSRLSNNTAFLNKTNSLDTADTMLHEEDLQITPLDSSAESTDNTSCTSVKLDTDSASGELQINNNNNNNGQRSASIENKTTTAAHFSPGKLFHYWARDESILNVTKLGTPSEDHFHTTKPRSLHTDDFRTLINGSTSKQSLRKQKLLNEELPLVRFDQFTQITPSPTELIQTSIDNGSSRTEDSRENFSNNIANCKKGGRTREQTIMSGNNVQNACYSVTNAGLTLSPESPENTM